MRTALSFRNALSGLVLLALGCMPAGLAYGGVQDSVFFISPDGSNVAFDVRDVSRREVLDRLLTSKSVELDWVDTSVADERISGAFKGSPDSVLQRLLAPTDFVVVYNRDGGQSRIARLIIVGKAASRSKSIDLPQLANNPAGQTPAPGEVPELKPMQGPVPLTPPTAADLAMPLFTPPPPGAQAPMLVPPTGAEQALPILRPPPAQGR